MPNISGGGEVFFVVEAAIVLTFGETVTKTSVPQVPDFSYKVKILLLFWQRSHIFRITKVLS